MNSADGRTGRERHSVKHKKQVEKKRTLTPGAFPEP
jgi:hypothetical protein